jgi:hypothetical protein
VTWECQTRTAGCGQEVGVTVALGSALPRRRDPVGARAPGTWSPVHGYAARCMGVEVVAWPRGRGYGTRSAAPVNRKR